MSEDSAVPDADQSPAEDDAAEPRGTAGKGATRYEEPAPVEG